MLLALLLQALPDYKPIYEAGERGTRFLREQAPALKENPDLAELVFSALVVGNTPDTDPAFQTLLGAVLSRPPASTRSAALQAAALVGLDRFKYRARIAHAVQLVLDQQADDGLWGPGGAVEPPRLPFSEPPVPGGPRKKPAVRLALLKPTPRARGPASGDLENAAWAVRTLRAGADAGIEAPADFLDRAQAAWRAPDRPAAEAVAALATLAELRKRNVRKDPDVLLALSRLERAPFPDTAAGLLPLRDAMFALGRDRLAERDWFLDGGEALRKAQQPDGSWGDVETTARAVLFIGLPVPMLHLPQVPPKR